MPTQLNKIGLRWGGNNDPEEFDCRLHRTREFNDAIQQWVIVWRLSTGCDVLTVEGEPIHQDETWELPPAAVTVAENIRSRVIARVKARNSMP